MKITNVLKENILEILIVLSFFLSVGSAITLLGQPKYLTEVDLNKLGVIRNNLEFEDTVKKISANAVK